VAWVISDSIRDPTERESRITADDGRSRSCCPRFAPQVDGATSHHVIEAEVFDSFADRPPIQIGMCGRVVPFETRELRALRAFVEAHRELLGEP
jgi:hypothetical protein